MKNYYYLDANNQQQGPVSEQALPAFGITAATLVWCEGMVQWMPAGQVPELAPYLSPAAGPGVPPVPPMGAGYAQPQPQPVRSFEICPDTNMVWAILSTILCCLPTGIYAIIRASKVESLYNMGDVEGARRASKDALTWSIIGAVASVVIGILYFFVILAAAL